MPEEVTREQFEKLKEKVDVLTDLIREHGHGELDELKADFKKDQLVQHHINEEARKSRVELKKGAARLENDADDDPKAHEACQQCGKKYAMIYWAPDEVWEKIKPDDETGGDLGGGLLCLPCADSRAMALGIVLRWQASTGWWLSTPAPDESQGGAS